MDLLKVHILNPNKIMQCMNFAQNIVETNCDMSIYPSKFKRRSIGFILIYME